MGNVSDLHFCKKASAKCLVHPCWLDHIMPKIYAVTMTTAISLQDVIGSVRHFHHCCVDKKDLRVLLYLAL